MRLVVARCSVKYEGRLDAHLPEAVRLVMVKADGCVAIHSDGGAYKPLNWMNAPNTIVETDEQWVVTNPKGETLTIIFHEIHVETNHEFGEDPGLQKDGVEQLARYLEVLRADANLVGLRGVFVAQSIKPQAKVIAEQRSIACVEVDYDDLRGRRPDDLRLF